MLPNCTLCKTMLPIVSAKGLRSDEKGQSCHIKHLLCLLCDKFCHIKHILVADVKHILAPQQQYARGARCALVTQIGVGLGCYAEPKQGGLVRPVATLCFMRWPFYTLCDKFTANLWFQFCKPMGKVTHFLPYYG